MFVAKFLAFALAVVGTSALTTGNLGRSVHHRALAARVAAPNPIAAPEPLVAAPLRKRNKRCKPRTTASPSAAATIIPVVANPGAAPTAPAAPAPNKESPAPAPKPTQKESPAPAPPKQTPASPPPASKPKPAPSNGNEPSFMTGPNTGDGTYYGTGLGACGITNNDNDLIAAVSKKLFDVYPGYQGGNPNNNPICGRKATATYQGNSVTVTITDRCEACDTDDLDFSPAAFRHLADQSIGRIHGMVWNWAD